MKKYSIIGSNLKMEMEANVHLLKIVGNNNYIKIIKNMGSVTIIGDECSIDVMDNYGSVEMRSASNTVKINVCNCDDSRNVDGSTELKEVPNRTVIKNQKEKKSFKVSLEKFISVYVKKALGRSKK
ncbi:hypothetical protein HW555_007964 [Spodoptera exigua]|uniref:Uncharacterized protein n=1 Tax=Spodoptera exigua TaxID=7107 RepID=A0A835GE18_SPOEX|nr:hypothetical protein HW555_007964 [Spodoptera exigua]